MDIDRDNIYSLLQKKMESVGYILESVQKPHFQNNREKELKFFHPGLEEKFAKSGLRNLAKKYYIKPLSDEAGCEIGLTTGKTSPLFELDAFPAPNAVDTYKNSDFNAWVNKENDDSLDILLTSIRNYLSLTLRDIEDDFINEVNKSMVESSNQRRSRLKHAPRIPDRIVVYTFVFKRNPDVVAEVLMRANGRCEKCGNSAPFIRKKDNSPYLEVHHKVQLSDEGEDTIENAIALCPNCHREQHFG